MGETQRVARPLRFPVAVTVSIDVGLQQCDKPAAKIIVVTLDDVARKGREDKRSDHDGKLNVPMRRRRTFKNALTKTRRTFSQSHP